MPHGNIAELILYLQSVIILLVPNCEEAIPFIPEYYHYIYYEVWLKSDENYWRSLISVSKI